VLTDSDFDIRHLLTEYTHPYTQAIVKLFQMFTQMCYCYIQQMITCECNS